MNEIDYMFDRLVKMDNKTNAIYIFDYVSDISGLKYFYRAIEITCEEEWNQCWDDLETFDMMIMKFIRTLSKEKYIKLITTTKRLYELRVFK